MRVSIAGLSFFLLSCGLSCNGALAADPGVIHADIDPARFGGWQGAYVGVSGGYGWLKDVDYAFTPPLPDKGKDWNFGAYGGYLAQFGNIVAGAEAEASRLGIDYEFLSFITVERSYALKARLGYAFDRFLVSGHAGGVYAETNFMGLKDWGWEAGAGIDYALTDNVTVGAQYSHYDFSNFDGTQIDARIDLLRARLGYRF